MFIVSSVLILNIVGSLGAWQPDIDINRLRLLSDEESYYRHPRNQHSRRSVFPQSRNDYDHHSSGFTALRPPMQPVSDTPSSAQKTLKVHQPREDPRLFYQSDTYAKEINENNMNNEVTAVYPGRDVVRAGGYYYSRPARLKERKSNDISYNEDMCVTCPHDRTLIAKPGSDRVILQHPRLKTCFGYRTPREVKFVPLYGPHFGSLLEKGSYKMLGHIKYKNSILKYCVMNVDVLIQTCALPKYLIADCDHNKCRFTCRDRKTELQGSSTLTCGDDMQWIGILPVCKARSWCEPLPPPAHGRVSCKGKTVDGWGLADGATCRVRCARGWKSNSRPVVVCRRGVWSHDFDCVSISV